MANPVLGQAGAANLDQFLPGLHPEWAVQVQAVLDQGMQVEVIVHGPLAHPLFSLAEKVLPPAAVAAFAFNIVGQAAKYVADRVCPLPKKTLDFLGAAQCLAKRKTALVDLQNPPKNWEETPMEVCTNEHLTVEGSIDEQCLLAHRVIDATNKIVTQYLIPAVGLATLAIGGGLLVHEIGKCFRYFRG